MLTVQDVFMIGLKMAISHDPRGELGVKKYLANIKRDFADLKPSDVPFFDQDKLTNPYLDSAILFDNGTKKVRRVLAGIDMTEPEILLASQLAERGQPIDLVIAHHPVGKARAYLHEVMDMSVDVYASYGVPLHLAEKIMEERIKEIGRWTHSVNHYKSVDVARLLNINFITTHTITDNLVDHFVHELLKKKQPETIKELLAVLSEVPEYQAAAKMGFGPKIFAGAPKHRVGKYLLEMTGGTTPSSRVYEEFSRAGISTLVSMHMQDDPLEKVNKHHMNVVVAGHMSSDSLGMNLFLDELERRGVEIIPAGGLIRVSRNGAAGKAGKKPHTKK